jgi:heme oxygenase
MLPLKEATSIKHKLAERMPFNTRMFKGLLSKYEYLFYLVQEEQIFHAIEHIGLPHNSLKRVETVHADIDELKAQGINSDTILNSTKAYADYLESLTYEQILPHVYLNYMAIMFGGQMMKKAVPSTGRLYVFENMQEAIQSIRNVQKDEWADEVNKGFDFNISILDELETECSKRELYST